MGKQKIIAGIAFIGIAVIGIVILGEIFYELSPSEVSEQPREIIVTKPPEQLLPTRSDVGTILEIKSSHFENTLDAEGFTIGSTQRYVKTENFFITSISVGVFMFDNPLNSFNFYTGQTQHLIDEGGFETTKISAHDATCFGTYKSTSNGSYPKQVYELRCTKGNVYVHVESILDNSSDDDPSLKFMIMVLDKIS